MAKINQQPPRTPMWPWGGPRSVRERIVDRTQLVNKKKTGKKGDAKNPPLASMELLEFIGPAHSADELRLPMPPHPEGRDGGDLTGYNDRPHLASVSHRLDDDGKKMMERGLSRITAPPERMDRLKALLAREEQMLSLVGEMAAEIAEIQRKLKEEQAGVGT